MPTYAAGTKVSPARSREEIQTLLGKWGATGFAYQEQVGGAGVGFEINGRLYRFLLKIPAFSDFKHDIRSAEAENKVRPQYRKSDATIKVAWEQMIREKWRAMVLMVKSKLIAVETGLTTLEEEFFANVVVQNGQTLYEYAEPQLDEAFRSGNMPKLLPTGR